MDYYPIKIGWHNKFYYAIYEFSDKDTLISLRGRLLFFESLDMIMEFISNENIKSFHNERVPIYNIDYVSKFVYGELMDVQDIDFRELLRGWNLFDDLVEDPSFFDAEFSGFSADSRWLHDKIVCSTDFFSNGDQVKLSWTIDEVAELKEVFIMGLVFFGDIMDKKAYLYKSS